jgi:ABC-2 type transport system ATP-binding protein
MSTAETIISVHDVTKVYGGGMFGGGGFRALDGISIEVGRGQVFGLLGPNGAGKTTLVKILLGLARRTSGDAQLFGRPVGDAQARTRVGYLPEGHRLPQYLTGIQMLELFGMMCGRDREYLRQRIPELLEQVGMKDAAGRKIREYSKGMTQRIGLAQALLHEPDLVILDEPTDGVDPVGRAAVRQIVAVAEARVARRSSSTRTSCMEVELHLRPRRDRRASGKILREGSIARARRRRTGRVPLRARAAAPADCSRVWSASSARTSRHLPGGFEAAALRCPARRGASTACAPRASRSAASPPGRLNARARLHPARAQGGPR